MEKKTTKKTEPKRTVNKIKTKAFKDLEGRFLHVRVGDKDRPAGDSDIEDMESRLRKLFEQNNVDCMAFVTHHAVDMCLIESIHS